MICRQSKPESEETFGRTTKMANQIVYYLWHLAAVPGATRMVHKGTLCRPLLSGCFAHVAPRRDLSPRVGKLANPGPEAATWAKRGRPWAKHSPPPQRARRIMDRVPAADEERFGELRAPEFFQPKYHVAKTIHSVIVHF